MAVRTVLRKITRRSTRPPKPPRERVNKPQRPKTPRPTTTTVPDEPLWVRILVDGGLPLVAVIVMVMCAPGEHHIATLAGWDSDLAWGMAAVLAAYAGIAAVVATRLRRVGRNTPGRRTATAGALVSLGLAMSAQPVSHMFVTGHWSAEPAAPVWLVIVGSCIPPLVLGHLLHVAAHAVSHVAARAARTVAPAVADVAPVAAPPVAWPLTVPAGATVLHLTCHRPATPDETPSQQRLANWVTTAAVAVRYGVKENTVRSWVERGKLQPAHKDRGGRLFFDEATLPSQRPVAAVSAVS